MPQDQFAHGQVGAVATGSIENWVSREGQSTQMSHAVATIPITRHPNALSEVAIPTDAASRAMVVSSQATPRGTKVSEVPTSSAVSAAARRVAANPGQLADSPLGSGANSSPASEAAPALPYGFAVQVASQRSQSGAQASFRKLQTKYPNQLRGHQPVIRRADLGAAGTYYRALVGPFASRDRLHQETWQYSCAVA
jgi:hypothetical protein